MSKPHRIKISRDVPGVIWGGKESLVAGLTGRVRKSYWRNGEGYLGIDLDRGGNIDIPSIFTEDI